jgi:RNA polymerase sigma-70 factor (family 1)
MHTDKRYDLEKTLKLLAQGSQYAFTQLFDYYRGQIFSIALKFLKSRELAEEVVQEVFLKVWMRREEMVNVLNFEGYLFTMTRNQVFDGIKIIAKESSAKIELSHSIQHVNGTDQPLIEQQYNELLHEVLTQLPPQQKQIFRLAKIEGLSHEAIAEQLHISRLTVKTHMAKACKTIRHKLQHHITTRILLPVVLLILDQ